VYKNGGWEDHSQHVDTFISFMNYWQQWKTFTERETIIYKMQSL
jgi:hypothetical protein